MRRTLQLLTFVVLLTVALSMQGQTATGVPPFSSTVGGPDIINLGSLNSHLCVPIIRKPGRGIPFTYSLCFDNSIWYPVGASGSQNWQPVQNWGWQAQTSAVVGYIAFTGSSGYCGQWNGHGMDYRYFTIFAFTAYVDQQGTSHPVGGSGALVVETSSGSVNCGPNYPGNASGVTNDGSGITLSVSANPSGTVTLRNGSTINPPLQATTGAGKMTDDNGNYVSTPGNGTFTDTLGLTALTISGTAPSNTTYQYTDSNGSPQTIMVSYTPSTPVQTNFNCSGISQYGPTNTYLISKITLPDNSYYQFGYETTPPGTGVVSGAVTGRLASIGLPTGGTISYTYPDAATNGIVCSDGSTSALTRQTPDGITRYTRTNVSGTDWYTLATDATTAQNQSLIWFQASANGYYETRRRIYSGTAPVPPTVGSPLRTVDTCYNTAAPDCTATALTLPITEQDVYTTLDNGSQSRIRSLFDSTYGRLLETDEYDFGANTATRKTIISYAANEPPDRVGSTQITDGNGSQQALTTYGYDAGTPTGTSNVPQHIAVSGTR